MWKEVKNKDGLVWLDLKKLIAAVERVGHYLEILRQDFNRQSNAIRTGHERSKHQRDIEPVWLEPILAKYDQSERNREKKDDAQYRVQNSLRWATWCTFGAVVIYAGITLLIYHANKKAANAATSAANTARSALEEARTNFLTEQRPIIWLTNDIGEPTVYVNPNNRSTAQIIWTWHFTNYGKTPTAKLTFRQYMKLGDRPPALAYGEKDVVTAAPIPPGKVDFDSVISEPMKQADATSLIASGGVSVLVVLEYTDAYHSTYETGFCLNRTNAGSIAYCKEGNYIK